MATVRKELAFPSRRSPQRSSHIYSHAPHVKALKRLDPVDLFQRIYIVHCKLIHAVSAG